MRRVIASIVCAVSCPGHVRRYGAVRASESPYRRYLETRRRAQQGHERAARGHLEPIGPDRHDDDGTLGQIPARRKSSIQPLA